MTDDRSAELAASLKPGDIVLWNGWIAEFRRYTQSQKRAVIRLITGSTKTVSPKKLSLYQK
jgi:hypothetical protein